MLDGSTNVIALTRRGSATAHPPRTILERIYAAGSLALPADDLPTKAAAAMLQALGLIVIHEILADGTARRVERGGTRAALHRPWRLAKPPFSGEIGVPDAVGVSAGR